MLRKILSVLVVVIVLLGVAVFFVYRNGVHPQLVLWIAKESWDRTESFEAVAEGETVVAGVNLSTTGRLRFLKPDLYDLDLNVARIMCGPKSLWVVAPAVKTGFRVHSASMRPAEILARIVASWDSRDPARWVDAAAGRPAEVKLYAPQVIEGQRCWVLEWPSRTGETIGGRLYVGQRSRAPVQFDHMDSAGQVVHSYKMTKFQRNTGLKPGDFEFAPMAGYSVVEVEYDPNDPVGLGRLLRGQAGTQGLRRKADEYLGSGAGDWMKRHGL